MEQDLEKHPENDGVHYSDLFESYVYGVKEKPRRALAEWLPDYFPRTESGTYRLPVPGEDDRLAALRQTGATRRIKRYIGFLENNLPIPVQERPDAATLADWIRHCKRSGQYAWGRVLFERGGLEMDHLSEEAAVNVEEDYQVCVRTLNRSAGQDGVRVKGKGLRGKKAAQGELLL